MKKIILAMVLAYCPFTLANELDEVPGSTTVSAAIPPTIVIRQDRTTGQMEVLEVGKTIPADRKLAAKLEKAPFKALSVDGQLAGLAADREADHVSSTSSWGFGFRRPYFGYGGYRGGYGYRGVGYAGYRGYGYGGYGGYGGYVGAMAPSYYYGGANYAYSPYYSYNYGNYSYAYCNPPAYTYAASCGSCYTIQPVSCGCGGNTWGGSSPYWQW